MLFRSAQRGLLWDCEGFRFSHLPPLSVVMACSSTLECPRWWMQSDELGTFLQPGQSNKACHVDGHGQKRNWRDSEGFRFSHLPPLSVDVACRSTLGCPRWGMQSDELGTFVQPGQGREACHVDGHGGAGHLIVWEWWYCSHLSPLNVGVAWKRINCMWLVGLDQLGVGHIFEC